jgi:hypothetical protein
MMGQEIGEYDFEYEAQIAYIDDRIKKTTDLKEIISLQDERAQLQIMQMQSQRGLIIELQEQRKYDPIDTPYPFSNLPPPDDISEPAGEDQPAGEEGMI